MNLINLERGRKCPFCEVKLGETFIFDHDDNAEVYMKTEPILKGSVFEINAVSLTDNGVTMAEKDWLVTVVNCKFES